MEKEKKIDIFRCVFTGKVKRARNESRVSASSYVSFDEALEALKNKCDMKNGVIDHNLCYGFESEYKGMDGKPVKLVMEPVFAPFERVKTQKVTNGLIS